MLLAGVIPRGDAPDEAAHLSYISHLADTWTLVDFRTESKGTEKHQPPLYYGLCALVSIVTGGSLFALRLVSTLCGLALILVSFGLARQWLPSGGFLLHWACAAAVGFLPMNLYVCSAVNNDPLVNALVAAGLLAMWATRDSQRPLRDAALVGAIAGLGMLTKSTALALVAAGFAWYGVAYLSRGRAKQELWRLVAFLGGLLVIWGPWAARNTVMYGDPLAARAFSALAAGAPPEMFGGPGLSYWVLWVAPFAWRTFWGAYDHLIHPDDFLPGAWYLAFAPLVILALLGLARALPGWLRTPERRALAASLAMGTLVLLVGFVGFNLNVFQAQARYFFCFLPVLLIALCAGLSSLGSRSGQLGVLVLMMLLAAGCADGVAWRMWFTGE